MEKETFIQVGVTALRSPTGEFLPSVPLYIKANNVKPTGLTKGEEQLLQKIAPAFIDLKNKNKEQKCQDIKK